MADFAGEIRTHVAPDEMGSNLVENGVHVADLHDALLPFSASTTSASPAPSPV